MDMAALVYVCFHIGVVIRMYGNPDHAPKQSFEIRMGRENGGQMLGGGICTQKHNSVWDHGTNLRRYESVFWGSYQT